MTYPTDMPTVDVTVGSVRHLETSKNLRFRISFEAEHPVAGDFPGLIWASTGQRFMAITESNTSTSELTFTLPATNAAGWKNFAGAPIDVDGGVLHTHCYRVQIVAIKDGVTQSSFTIEKVFLPEGVSPVDLDDLISVPQEPGTPIDFPDVWGALVQQAEAAALAAQWAAQDAESAAELVRDNSIVDASLAGQDLVFEKHDLSTINVGRVAGLSAFEQSGFTGTIEQWLDSLEGASSLTGNGPPAITGRKVDQPYLDADTGDIYSWSGSSWTLVGNIASVVPGPPNTLTIGTVTEGATPAASITGTSPNQTLDLTLKTGAPGPANTLNIGTVVEGPTADATITGTSPSQTLNLVLPEADPGPPNTLTAGTITQIPAGGQPTFSITGTAPDQTLNLGLVDGSPTAFELRGEGFPGTGSNATATNAASPGTYYTDTLGTNGAWRWLKTSAGSGNTRWEPISPRSGWRNMTSLAAGIDPANTGTLRVKREGNLVTWAFNNLLLTQGSGILTIISSIPSGIRPDAFGAGYKVGEAYRNNSLAHTQLVAANGNTLAWMLERNESANAVAATRPSVGISGQFSLLTHESWPASWPGTP